MFKRFLQLSAVALTLGFSIVAAHAGTLLRVLHVSPDAPAVDIRLNGRLVMYSLAYLASADYLSVDPGSTRIQVSPAGASTPVVIDATVNLADNVAYTVAATGLLGNGTLAPVVLIDDRSTIAGSAKVRFTHASPDAPSVDVALAGGAVVFPNKAFRESSSYAELPPGTYDLEVRLAGSSTVALPLPGVQLSAGTNYDVFAIGLAGGGTLGALPLLTATPAKAKLRLAHLSPDAPSVDVRLDGEVALSNVPFGAISNYLQVPAGGRRIQVTPTGATEPVVIDATVNLDGGRSYTAAATGLLGASDLAPIVLSDDRTVDAAKARVRFVHASPDAPSVDVAVAGGPVVFGDVAFREASEYLPLDPGTYDLEVRVAGTSTVALELDGVKLFPGTVLTVFATGLLGDGTLGALSSVEADEIFLRGDSNRDRRLDISDPVSTLHYLFLGSVSTFCPDAADADDSGHVTIGDAGYTFNYLFRGGPQPAGPFPLPGVDETEDGLLCSERS